MLKENMIIGLGSVATAGKDTFFNLFNKKFPNSKRFSLAHELKQELYEYILNEFRVDIFKCSGAEKEKFRPFLVHHAKIRREESNNRYFTNILESAIRRFHKCYPSHIAVITDIRHNSDCDWLKKEMGGILVHIQRYSEEKIFTGNTLSENGELVPHWGLNQEFVQPANEVEEKDDPYLIKNADYRVIWPNSVNWGTFEDLEIYVDEFIKWLNR